MQFALVPSAAGGGQELSKMAMIEDQANERVTEMVYEHQWKLVTMDLE